MPIVHAPTFNVTNKPTILISAMQACGALYVKTPTASNFIMQTLANNRDEIMAAFVSIRICLSSNFAPSSAAYTHNDHL